MLELLFSHESIVKEEVEQYTFPWQEPLLETCEDLRMIMLSKPR